MIIRKKRITGMLLLALSATAFTVSSVVLIATWFSGLPAWVMLPTLMGAASGITGARLVTATKSTGLGISISLLCVAALLCVALIALKTEMFGDPNIGAGFIALIGVVLQPAGAVISLTTLVTMLVRSRNSIVSGA